jgi:hypothetical protein
MGRLSRISIYVKNHMFSVDIVYYSHASGTTVVPAGELGAEAGKSLLGDGVGL